MARLVNPLHTVGHSNHPIDKLIGLLAKNEIGLVYDVRSVPRSRRWPQYDREALARALQCAGIGYQHLGDALGARTGDPSCFVSGRVSFERIAARPAFGAGLERIRRTCETRRPALLCAEKDPLDCHRTVLVCRHIRQIVPDVRHIHANGKVETHAELEERLLSAEGLEAPLFESTGDREEAIERAYRLRTEQMEGRSRAVMG